MNTAAQVTDLIAEWKADGTNATQLVVKDAEAKLGWPYAWGATGQYCTTANRKAKMANARITAGDKALIQKRCQILNGSKSSCDGCAYFPDEQRTRMYDCIGFINSLLDDAGIAHYGAGCSIMWNHAANWAAKGKLSDMPEMVCLVFQQKPGDASKMQHIGLYIGGGWVIHCSEPVKKQKLSAYPWTHYAVLKGLGGDVPVPDPTLPTLRKGSRGEYVTKLQTLLIQQGYDVGPTGADGKYGDRTAQAVTRFQNDHGLKPDGVCGPMTWEALLDGKTVTYTVTIRNVSKTVAEGIIRTYGGDMTAEGE